MPGETALLPIPDKSMLTHLAFGELHVVDIGPKTGVKARIAFADATGQSFGQTAMISGGGSFGPSMFSEESLDLLRQLKASILRDCARNLSAGASISPEEGEIGDEPDEDDWGEDEIDIA